MNKRILTKLTIIISIIFLFGGTLQAQMFDVDASAIEKSYTERHDNRLPEDFFDDPDNVERFLQQFYREGEKIVGGEDVDIADYPWQASLQLMGGQHYCGAVLVDEHWAITAAHCLVSGQGEVNPSQIRLRVGFSSMSSGEGSFHNISDHIIYPDYNPEGFQFDIALLNLSNPLNLEDENVATAGRVTQHDADQGMTDPGEMVKISGWGALSYQGNSPDILQAIEVPIIDVNDTSYPSHQISDDMIIAGADGMDSCQGDSGGPMVVEDGEGWYKVAGIVSFGVECGLPNFPGVYARVSYFENWLNQYLILPDPNQYTTMHHETFGAGDIPPDWINEVIEGPAGFPGWEWTDTGGDYGGQLNSTTADDGYMILDSDAHGIEDTAEEADLISPAFDFTDITSNLFFSVEHWARTFGNADVRIYISTDDFNTQTQLYRWHDASQNDAIGPNPVLSEFDITDIAQGESNVRIKFKWIGSYDYWWLVDDFKLWFENPGKQVHFVVTDGEEPLENVFISTQYSDQETMTDANGEAELALYEGTYEITAEKEGYFHYEETIEVTEDGQVVHIEMDKIPVPEIVIDTEEIELTLPQGITGELVVNIANPGELELEYSLFAYATDKEHRLANNKTQTTAHYEDLQTEPGASLTLDPNTTPANLPASPGKDDDNIETVEIHHDSGYSGGLGVGANNIITAARFTAEDLAGYYGLYDLSAVKYHIRTSNFNAVTVKIWEGGSDTGPENEIYSQNVTDDVIINDWSTHILDETISLTPGEEYWIGYAMEATGGFPLSVDSGPMVEGKGGWVYIGGWNELTNLDSDLDYNWCIRGILQFTDPIEWLTFDPQSGVVAPESDIDVDFMFSAEDLELGAHHAEVIVLNNAGENINIPVTLIVDPPEYDITFEVIDADGNNIDDATINLGQETNAPGDYVFHDIPVGLYNYEVTKEEYHTAKGQIQLVDGDLLVEVILIDEETDLVTLNVSIEDEFGDPAEGAYFEIKGFGGQLSDADGELSVMIIPDTYEFMVHKTGFEDKIDEVVVTSDSEQLLDVMLTYLRFDVTLDVNPDEAGIVDGEGEYYYGQTVTIEAHPNTGYHFIEWLEGGLQVTDEEEYSFMITEDRDFMAVFDINTYIVTSSFSGLGGIDPLGDIEVAHGDDITFIIAPSPGNYIEDVLVNEESVGPVEEYTFENVTEDGQTIHAEFAMITHEVTITSEGNGTVEPYGTIEAPHGEPLFMEFTPDEGHHVADVLINNHSVGSHDDYMISTVTGNTTVHVIFEITTHEVTITSEGNGTVDPYGTIDVPHGEALLIEFTPDEDHHVADVLLNNNSIGAHDDYLISNVTGNTTVHVVFEFSVGVDKMDELPDLTVFPNPAMDHVTISSEEVIREIRLYNLTGQTIKSVKPGAGEYQMNIGQLQSGMYLLQVSYENGVQTVSLKVE